MLPSLGRLSRSLLPYQGHGQAHAQADGTAPPPCGAARVARSSAALLRPPRPRCHDVCALPCTRQSPDPSSLGDAQRTRSSPDPCCLPPLLLRVLLLPRWAAGAGAAAAAAAAVDAARPPVFVCVAGNDRAGPAQCLRLVKTCASNSTPSLTSAVQLVAFAAGFASYRASDPAALLIADDDDLLMALINVHVCVRGCSQNKNEDLRRSQGLAVQCMRRFCAFRLTVCCMHLEQPLPCFTRLLRIHMRLCAQDTRKSVRCKQSMRALLLSCALLLPLRWTRIVCRAPLASKRRRPRATSLFALFPPPHAPRHCIRGAR